MVVVLKIGQQIPLGLVFVHVMQLLRGLFQNYNALAYDR